MLNGEYCEYLKPEVGDRRISVNLNTSIRDFKYKSEISRHRNMEIYRYKLWLYNMWEIYELRPEFEIAMGKVEKLESYLTKAYRIIYNI